MELNWTTIISAAIVAAPGIYATWQNSRTHKLLNGITQQRVDEASAAGKVQGQLDEKKAEQARNEAAPGVDRRRP